MRTAAYDARDARVTLIRIDRERIDDERASCQYCRGKSRRYSKTIRILYTNEWDGISIVVMWYKLTN